MLGMARGVYREWLKRENLILIQGWKRNGLTDAQIAKNIGVSRPTFEVWRSKYPRIDEAVKIGKQQANFIVEGELFKRAVNGNVTAMIFWLKNNWRDKYNDSQLSTEERNLANQRARKLSAEADIEENKAQAIKDADTDDGVVIIDDIPKDDDDAGQSKPNQRD